MNPRAREGLALALDGHPFVSVSDLEADIASGIGHVWSGKAADVFVRIERGVCSMGPAAGDPRELIESALPAIERWALKNRCVEMHVQAGRQGWARLLAPYGYEVAAIIMRKAL